ncbi:allophanate hydrolase subunit 1 (plasmid) [Rhizobium sp. NIBRBAC000502774]|nr:allophanate hydrolase subunit 1 [Rhizobium sp. NIBRBAC000502774]
MSDQPITEESKVELRFSLLGTMAVLIETSAGLDLTTQQRFWSLSDIIGASAGVIETVLGMNNLLVVYDPFQQTPSRIEAQVSEAWRHVEPKALNGRVIRIPAIYGGERGPDLPALCEKTGLTVEQIAEIHSSKDYTVFAPGAAPGFGYLYGLDRRLFMARKPVPAMRKFSNSINIGGYQTSLSPKPGITGWNAIGYSPDAPVPFDPNRNPMSIVNIGDTIRFTLEGFG